jgi:hypothetical protein
MLWNISATTSMMAFSPAVTSFFLQFGGTLAHRPASCTTAAGL